MAFTMPGQPGQGMHAPKLKSEPQASPAINALHPPAWPTQAGIRPLHQSFRLMLHRAQPPEMLDRRTRSARLGAALRARCARCGPKLHAACGHRSGAGTHVESGQGIACTPAIHGDDAALQSLVCDSMLLLSDLNGLACHNGSCGMACMPERADAGMQGVRGTMTHHDQHASSSMLPMLGATLQPEHAMLRADTELFTTFQVYETLK